MFNDKDLLKKADMLVEINAKVRSLRSLFEFFINNEWIYKTDRIEEMFNKLSPLDQQLFMCDVKTINWRDYIYIW